MDYNARYYDPYLGRFISADTIVPDPGNPQALNRYSYVRNSPLRYNDPSGHCAPGEPGCPYDEDGNPKPPSPRYTPWVTFAGDWGEDYRANVVAGAQAVGRALNRALKEENLALRRSGENPRTITDGPQETFLKTVGQVTFRIMPQCGAEKPVGCSYGVDAGTWGWSQIGALGEVWINVNAFGGTYAGFAGEQNTVHELMHGIDQRGGGVAGSNLETAWATNNLLTRGAGGFAVGGGWQQSTELTGSEVFADMGLGWTYGRWQSDSTAVDYGAGVVKSRYMGVNMPGVLALAVAGH